MLKLLLTILEIAFGGASSKPSKPIPPKEEPKPEPQPVEPKAEKQKIDWNDPVCKISKYFTVKDAIWLPEWKRLGNQPEDGLTDEVRQNLIKTFQWMDAIREWLGKPIRVHLAFRSMAYHLDLYKRLNEKRAKNNQPALKVPMRSAHLMGEAVDCSVIGMTCDEVKKKVLDEKKLEELSLRMEDNGWGANWVHFDSKAPGATGRFFKP